MQNTRIIKAIKEKAFTAMVLLASIGLYAVANNFEYVAKPGRLGPDFWPKMILSIIVILAAIDIGATLFKGGSEEKEQRAAATGSETGKDGPVPEAKKRYPALLFIGIMMTVGYVFLIGYLGFALTTFFYLTGFMYVGRYRRHMTIWISSLIGTLFLVFVFVKIVYVSLPSGVFPFNGLTYLLYAVMGIQ